MTAAVLALIIVATTSQGAFAIGRWAPLGLLLVAILIGAVGARGRLVVRSRAAVAALAGIWGLAAWSLLSMLWAQSPGQAFVAADEAMLYAAIATLPLVLPVSRESLRVGSWTAIFTVALLAVYTVVHLFLDGSSWFLAGRLNGPINYRNATAVLFALPVWPLIVPAAARANPRTLRALLLGLASLCLSLAFLTQSRGILIGLVVGGAVVLATGPDRVRRAWLAIVVVGFVAAASHWLLAPYHAFDGGHGYVTQHQITVAALAVAGSSLAVFLSGLLLAIFDSGLRPTSPRIRHVRLAARVALAAVTLVAIVGALVAIGNPVSYAREKWDEFRSLQTTTSADSRLLSGGGQRYDLWRIALKEFDGTPVLGVGAGNYSFDYYRYRRTTRNLSTAHSLFFSLLSETGIVGLLLFISFLTGLIAMIARGWRKLSRPEKRAVAAAAAAGSVWLAQSMVDWFWSIPGLSAVGVLMLSLAAAQAAVPKRSAPNPDLPRLRARWRLARAAPLLIVAASILALYLSNAYIERARSVTADPRAELAAARTAATFDPWSVTPHYLQASAYESLGERRLAYLQLSRALSFEPLNSGTLGVLGDFEARGHDFAAARAYYRRALALDPLDTGLQQLARIGLRS